MLEYNNFNLYLIRHGESVRNQDKDYVGQEPDTKLSDLGAIQATALRNRFIKQNIQPDIVWSSNYDRALNTAKIVFPDSTIKITEELREYSAGKWTGSSRSELYKDPIIKQRMAIMQNSFLPPDGESMSMVERRASKWLEDQILYNINVQQLSQSLNRPVEIFAFSHGMTIKVLLTYLCGIDRSMTWKIDIHNTSISKLSFNTGAGWKLKCINDTAHLL